MDGFSSANTQFATVTEKVISGVHVSPGSAATLVRRGGLTNHHSMSYYLSSISAKNYQKQLMCIEVMVCNISVVFLSHSVVKLLVELLQVTTDAGDCTDHLCNFFVQCVRKK